MPLEHFITWLIHLWLWIHCHRMHHITHGMPHSYRVHIHILEHQINWLFNHVSGHA